MKARIVVTLKPTVLDAQGATVEKALHNLGFAGVKDVRIGKYVELALPDGEEADVEAQVDEMCQKLLANPIIEDFRFELDSA
jgi:phosphoribosylformylglycinamidine synthase PurS subunit